MQSDIKPLRGLYFFAVFFIAIIEERRIRPTALELLIEMASSLFFCLSIVFLCQCIGATPPFWDTPNVSYVLVSMLFSEKSHPTTQEESRMPNKVKDASGEEYFVMDIEYYGKKGDRIRYLLDNGQWVKAEEVEVVD